MNRKDRRAAQALGRGTDPGAGDHSQRLFAQALQQHQLGQFAEAERHYRTLLAVKPRHEHSLYNLGLLALQTDRTEFAAEMLGKAVAINGGDAGWRYNYAYALRQSGRDDDAVEQYRQAVSLKPDYAEAHLNLGNLFMELGRLAEATGSYERVAALKPDFAETHYNLGNVLALQGRRDEAIVCFERSIALKPMAEAHNNLGIALARDPARAEEAFAQYRHALALKPGFVEAENNIANLHAARGELEQAVEAYRRVVATHPDYADGHENLARALISMGDSLAAVPVVVRALELRENAATRRLFVTGMKQVRSASDHPALRALVIRALTESWGYPADLANIVIGLIKTGPDTAGCVTRAGEAWPRRLPAGALFGEAGAAPVFRDPLLLAWLETSRVTDLDIERCLTTARALLLQRAAGSADEADASTVRFASALAQQCFTNDFVFATADDEVAQLAQLRETIATALASGAAIAPLPLLAIAAYGRLDALTNADRLLERAWPDALQPVLTQQLREPSEEQSLRAAMPQLTPVTDTVSRQVQAQYEQNPYPRWIKVPRETPASEIDARHDRVSLPTLRPYGDGIGTAVLIAGCGTGQHVVGIAQRYPQARILAVDLSMASLGYAARKTREFGLTNVEYAQADILEFGSAGRSFDVIEASGVLHHLADPFAGWRVLLSALKPGGFMQVGLYSERARQQVVAARRFIAERGYGASAEDIRRARQDLIDAARTDALLREVTEIGDFYTVSDCRDLLFHVQEHRLTLPQIKTFLREAGLWFRGFELDPAQTRAYARQFPDDPTMTDLDNWHLFEAQNPGTFINMYQFWVQRLA
jgi:tetratricopeptide (TPR) repeat protein/SAM-dependent methyltransferase